MGTSASDLPPEKLSSRAAAAPRASTRARRIPVVIADPKMKITLQDARVRPPARRPNLAADATTAKPSASTPTNRYLRLRSRG